ncbi:hypothetical protein MTO96_005054 [Rhipicephalus appendiculatus]
MIVPRRVLSRTPNRSGPTAQRHLRALPADLGEAASANRRIPRCRRLLWDQLLSYQFERSLGPKLRNEKKTDSCVSVAADRKSGARVSASRQCPRKQNPAASLEFVELRSRRANGATSRAEAKKPTLRSSSSSRRAPPVFLLGQPAGFLDFHQRRRQTLARSLISGRPPGALNFSLLVAAAAATFRASKWTPPGHSLHKALRNNHVC